MLSSRSPHISPSCAVRVPPRSCLPQQRLLASTRWVLSIATRWPASFAPGRRQRPPAVRLVCRLSSRSLRRHVDPGLSNRPASLFDIDPVAFAWKEPWRQGQVHPRSIGCEAYSGGPDCDPYSLMRLTRPLQASLGSSLRSSETGPTFRSACAVGRMIRLRLHTSRTWPHATRSNGYHNDVLFHDPSRRQLQDIVTCIRNRTTIDSIGFDRERHADRFLKAPEEMHRLFSEYPEALARTRESSTAVVSI